MKVTNDNFASSGCCAAFSPLFNITTREPQEVIAGLSAWPNIMPKVGSKPGPVKPVKRKADKDETEDKQKEPTDDSDDEMSQELKRILIHAGKLEPEDSEEVKRIVKNARYFGVIRQDSGSITKRG